MSSMVGVVEMVSKGLGDTARDIAISIALAAVIGMCLMEKRWRGQGGAAFPGVLRRETGRLGTAVELTFLSAPDLLRHDVPYSMVRWRMALRMRMGRTSRQPSWCAAAAR